MKSMLLFFGPPNAGAERRGYNVCQKSIRLPPVRSRPLQSFVMQAVSDVGMASLQLAHHPAIKLLSMASSTSRLATTYQLQSGPVAVLRQNNRKGRHVRKTLWLKWLYLQMSNVREVFQVFKVDTKSQAKNDPNSILF